MAEEARSCHGQYHGWEAMVGYTRNWAEEPAQQAARRIEKAKHTGTLTFRTVLAALRDFSSSDEPTVRDARRAAAVLGSLRIDELHALMSDAAADLMGGAGYEAHRIEQTIRERAPGALEGGGSRGSRTVTVAEIRQAGGLLDSRLVWTALTLQALVWAVNPPDEEFCLFVL